MKNGILTAGLLHGLEEAPNKSIEVLASSKQACFKHAILNLHCNDKILQSVKHLRMYSAAACSNNMIQMHNKLKHKQILSAAKSTTQTDAAWRLLFHISLSLFSRKHRIYLTTNNFEPKSNKSVCHNMHWNFHVKSVADMIQLTNIYQYWMISHQSIKHLLIARNKWSHLKAKKPASQTATVGGRPTHRIAGHQRAHFPTYEQISVRLPCK